MSGTNTGQNLDSSTTGETGATSVTSKMPSSIGGAAAVGDQSGGSQPLTGRDESNSTIGAIDGSGTPSAGGAGGGT